MFLDFDGTLVPFAPTPDGITVPPAVPGLLSDLSTVTQGATALVSGRSIADLDHFLPMPGLTKVGGHGAEHRIGSRHQSHPLTGSEVVSGLVRAASAFAGTRAGVVVEPKPAGVVLHYRQVPELEAEITAFARSLAAAHPGIELHLAKMACELRPDDVGKGHAVATLLDHPLFAGRGPVMVGDDATDEPAMAVAQDRGGVGIKVGPGETVARHRVDGPEDVPRLLRAWTERDRG